MVCDMVRSLTTVSLTVVKRDSVCVGPDSVEVSLNVVEIVSVAVVAVRV